ncbi:MAG: hypothetical protein RQ723_05100 [Desulfuromonadales bacterium]|nr:hypothetical protein [Desulfuromonadales bacterium]
MLSFCPLVVAADDNAPPSLPPVTVTGTVVDQLSGTSELSSAVLSNLPQKNGSLTETITLLPRVQIGEGQRTSENAGEILPPRISISGGRAYENFYAVDGLSIGSLLDPLSTDTFAENIVKVPGHPQRSFIHQDLIESVTVYDSNVPAKFGRFTGGVVDAQTRDPAPELSGALRYRTTRHNWTQLHIDPQRREAFELSNDFQQQPRFVKQDAGAQFNIPLRSDMAVLAAYNILRSDKEFYHLGDWKTWSDQTENWFLKYLWTPSTDSKLELTATYTPASSEFFIVNTRESDLDIRRGGYGFNSRFSTSLDAGDLVISAGYQFNENSRDATASSYTFWPADTLTRDWGERLDLPYSAEGGYGDIDTDEESLQLNIDFESRPVGSGPLTQTVNAGIEAGRDHGSYQRKDNTLVHALNRAVKDADIACAPDDPACLDGLVYFRERRLYESQDAEATINRYAAYLEDRIDIGRISLRPGARLSHDNFMDNTNLAHRLAGSWDLFGNGDTLLLSGVNRYYGETLLTYKLREAKEPYIIQSRSKTADNRLTNWTVSGTQNLLPEKFSKLDTPYSDEWNIGLRQQLFGGTLDINYLERRNRDQFAKELRVVELAGETVREWLLNNHGSSRYESLNVSWERHWHRHFLHVNYTWSDAEAYGESYDDLFDEEDRYEKVWFDGKVIDKESLPRSDSFREHAANLIYSGRLPGELTFTNVTRYVSGYQTRELLSRTEKTARDIPVDLVAYDSKRQPDYWIFDWRLDWQPKFYSGQPLTLSLEIDNVFDRTPPVAGKENVFELGRQVWLAARYTF